MITYKKVKSGYNKAVKEQKTSFVIEGVTFLTTYAKYLLEFVDSYPKEQRQFIKFV